jgi:hypothetical protein
MSRRFMIVRPTSCCKDTQSIGDVYEFKGYVDCICSCDCGSEEFGTFVENMSDSEVIEMDRIIFLPDESDIIEHDTIQEIEDKLKV